MELNMDLDKFNTEIVQETTIPFKEKFFHFLTRSNKQYIKESLNFFSDRGIENRLLSNLIEYLPDGAIIAGGFILSVINEDKNASDIDFFFTSEEAFRKTLDLFLNRSNTDKKESWAYDGYSLKEGTDLEKSISNHSVRSITLVHPIRPAIQLIKMVWYDSPEHVIDTFDFTVSQVAVDNKGFYFGGGYVD